jgi:hypothetical protein
MSANPTAQERASIRTMCWQLRKLLLAEKPDGFMAIFQDIGNIEVEVLIASGDQLQDVKRSRNDLLRSLRKFGIINPQNWGEFFGEPEPE